MRVVPRSLLPSWAPPSDTEPSLKTAFVHTALRREDLPRYLLGLAREHGVYLLAGTIYTPPIEYEASRGGTRRRCQTRPTSSRPRASACDGSR
jgi:hypothetical protein